MMSDTRLQGRVFWLLMTARIHLLSPDIRRPGQVEDLIIPVLDPRGEDREEFLRWAVEPVVAEELTDKEMDKLSGAAKECSAAGFTALRSVLKARASARGEKLTFKEVLEILEDHLPPDIGETHRYQTLQALLNCTRRSLLPDPSVSEEERQAWREEIRNLEARGVR